MKTLRTALATGRPLLGLCNMYPAPGMLERIAADWDWVWIDGQHGEMGYQDLLAAVRACNLADVPAIVRVPGHEFGSIGLALDMGSSGVLVPVVDNVAEALDVVKAAKFPPFGGRSYGGRRPIDRQGRLYADSANEDTLLICQIESPEAVENADRIAAIPGVDGLFIGPDDLLLRRGRKMDEPRTPELLTPDMDRVIRACQKHGKIGCMVGMGDDMLKLCLSMGYQMVVAGGDVPFLANGSRQAAADARRIVADLAASTAGRTAPAPASP